MGEAIIAGLLRNGLAKPENIRAAGPIVERGEELEQFIWRSTILR